MRVAWGCPPAIAGPASSFDHAHLPSTPLPCFRSIWVRTRLGVGAKIPSGPLAWGGGSGPGPHPGGEWALRQACVQVKSVKPCLKQLQQCIQTISTLHDDEILPSNPADLFHWLPKEHMCVLVYLVSPCGRAWAPSGPC